MAVHLWSAHDNGHAERAHGAQSPRVAAARAATWRAHCRLNDDGNLELFEGKRSLGNGLHVATREPRRGGWEGGAHRRSCFMVVCEGPKEWSRQQEKWSGRSSLAARNSRRGRGTTGGGCRWWGAPGGTLVAQLSSPAPQVGSQCRRRALTRHLFWSGRTTRRRLIGGW
jgi:hypothetical protein